MEFTQPLGVGLGLAVRINNQYSHPVCMGRRMDAYGTINNTWEISWKTGYLLSNIDAGIWEFAGMEFHVNDVQMMHQLGYHWEVAQNDCTNQSHK